MFKKQKQLYKHLDEYKKNAAATFKLFIEFIEYILENGVDEKAEKLVTRISDKESDCDKARFSIEKEMFDNSLLPNTRENILEVYRLFDKIPNHCENIGFMIIDQRCSIVKDLKELIREMLKVVKRSFKLTLEASGEEISELSELRRFARNIDNDRSLCHGIERKAVKIIFSLDTFASHPGGQLAQKEIVSEISKISESCRTLMEKILLIAVKEHTT